MNDYVAKSVVEKFGYTGNVASGAINEEIWVGESAYPGFVAAGATTTIVSSSADDDLTGTGAQTVTVVGLVNTAGLWVETTETVDMDGVTPVALSNDYIRVYRAFNATTGSGGVNAGNIDVLHGATILARIGTAFGQTLQATYTVPDILLDNQDISGGQIKRWYATVGAAASAIATVALQTNEAGAGWRTRRISGVAEGGYFDQMCNISVFSHTDIRIRILTVGSNNSTLDGGFDVELF